MSIPSAWRADLAANSRQRGRRGAVLAWFLSPGFKAVTLYRWSRAMRASGGVGALISKFFWRYCVGATGCYISPWAELGPGLALPHAVGIVIGEGVVIGTGVTLYQNVTLGRARRDQEAYPIIEEGVTIYAGAVIVGPVRVGRGAVIGANAVVSQDIPDDSVAMGVPAKPFTREARVSERTSQDRSPANPCAVAL